MKPAKSPVPRNPIRPKILVIDDNAENRALAQATLEDEGYEVALAASGEEGLKAFQEMKPNCVLLDVRMPGTDGFEVCRRIRLLEQGTETPIIFFTALRDIDTFDRALGAGAADFLAKPVRPTELAIRVGSALKLGRMSSELREQYEIVRRQRDDLMRLHLQKERLSAFLVHDLKNPLNALDLNAQLALRDDTLKPGVRDSIKRIRAEVRQLLRMVMNLLDISRSEEGVLAPRAEPVDLGSLIDEVSEVHAPVAESAGVTITRGVGVETLAVDADLLRRVLENLVDNAIRHAPAESEIKLTATERGGFVEIRVADAGPGIPQEMRARVFEHFIQLDSEAASKTRTGRGLGLAFCKVAVQAHGGTIAIEDAGPGTTFLVRLPR